MLLLAIVPRPSEQEKQKSARRKEPRGLLNEDDTKWEEYALIRE